jgi:hypothetical protein
LWNFDRWLQVFIAFCGAVGLAYIIYDHWPSAAQDSTSMIGPFYWWPYVLIALCCAAFASQWLRWLLRWKPTPQPIQTSLRLLFNVGSDTPIGLDMANIWRWYALTHIMRAIDPKGKKPPQEVRGCSRFSLYSMHRLHFSRSYWSPEAPRCPRMR